MTPSTPSAGSGAGATAEPVIDPAPNPSPYMRGIPVPRQWRITRDLSWATDREKALWATQNLSQIVPVDVVWRGNGPVWSLPYGRSALDTEVTGPDGRSMNLLAAIVQNDFDGLLAIRGGRIVAEVYRNGMRPNSRHSMFSMTKSMAAMTCGLLIADGVLDPARPARTYLPELDGTGFRDATLQQVLDMTSSVVWNQDRSNPQAGVNINSIAGGFTTLPIEVPFENTLEFISSIPQKGPHGEVFTYNSTNSEILGWIISRACGEPWQKVFARRIWAGIGAEEDALIAVDGGGHGFATAGMQATLRDLGRIGLMLARRGRRGDAQVVPAAFVDDIGINDPVLRLAMNRSGGGLAGRNMGHDERAYYRNQFWVLDGPRGEFRALGFLGQMIHVDRQADTVVICLAAVPGPDTWLRELSLARQIAAWPAGS